MRGVATRVPAGAPDGHNTVLAPPTARNAVTDSTQADSRDVLRLAGLDAVDVRTLLGRFGLTLRIVPPDEPIPGSFWGDEEAGLRGNHLLARPDTPIHSVLHEACHFVCMTPERRRGLDTDAGGDYEEENGVCFLQIVLADHLRGMDRHRMMRDMDAWGYSFRLGSARSWFEGDAEEARDFLARHELIDTDGRPTWKLRQAPNGT
jgi:hypothetical protein